MATNSTGRETAGRDIITINSLWTFPSLGRSKLSAGTVDDGAEFHKSSGGFTMRDS